MEQLPCERIVESGALPNLSRKSDTKVFAKAIWLSIKWMPLLAQLGYLTPMGRGLQFILFVSPKEI